MAERKGRKHARMYVRVCIRKAQGALLWSPSVPLPLPLPLHLSRASPHPQPSAGAVVLGPGIVGFGRPRLCLSIPYSPRPPAFPPHTTPAPRPPPPRPPHPPSPPTHPPAPPPPPFSPPPPPPHAHPGVWASARPRVRASPAAPQAPARPPHPPAPTPVHTHGAFVKVGSGGVRREVGGEARVRGRQG